MLSLPTGGEGTEGPIPILRNEIFSLKIFLQKLGVFDADEFVAFRAKFATEMAANEEIEELERLLATSQDKAPEEL